MEVSAKIHIGLPHPPPHIVLCSGRYNEQLEIGWPRQDKDWHDRRILMRPLIALQATAFCEYIKQSRSWNKSQNKDIKPSFQNDIPSILQQ